MEKDPEVKKTLIGVLQNETLPLYMDHLEKLAKENYGYLAVGRVSFESLQFVVCDIAKNRFPIFIDL